MAPQKRDKSKTSPERSGLASRDEEYSLVYSTDPLPTPRCSGCLMPKEQCKCPPLRFSGKLNPAFRIEKKGRGGKSVTVIFKLPAHETLLKDLCSFLKRSVGGGGTYYIADGAGCIEIQGERTEELKSLVAKYETRGA